MLDLGQERELALELSELGGIFRWAVQELQRNVALKIVVVDEQDPAHPAASELARYFVAWWQLIERIRTHALCTQNRGGVGTAAPPRVSSEEDSTITARQDT